MKDRELERINRVVRVNKKGDPKIVDMARFYTANEALELYYSRKSKGEDVRFFCVGSSRYSDYCNAPMELYKGEDGHNYFRLSTKKICKHIRGCSEAERYGEIDDCRISLRVDTLSMRDFHGTICSDSGMAPFVKASDGIRYREPETLPELYEKLSAAPIHAMTKDGRMVADVFLSSRTVSGYRTGTRSIGGPMLVLAMTSFDKELFNAVAKASEHPILMMQDPFCCSSASESICFILSFEDDKAGQSLRKKFSAKLGKRKGVRDDGTRRTNDCLFMLEADWVPLSRMRLDVMKLSAPEREALHSRPVFFGRMHSIRQIEELRGNLFNEIRSCLVDRISNTYRTD